MSDWQVAGLYLFGALQGVAFGWLVWRRKSLAYATQHAEIMTAGYGSALQKAADALELWERTRSGWQDDGTTTTPAATAMQLAQALGYVRTAAMACRGTLTNAIATQETNLER